MPISERENERPPVHQDVEIRIVNFRNFTITALRNFIFFILHVGMLWFSTAVVPHTSSTPFLVRWACIVFLYLVTLAKSAWLFTIIDAITSIPESDIEDEQRPRNRNLGARIANLEDWILANFCVLLGLSTIGFVAWYWIKVTSFTFWAFLYWISTMGGLFLIFLLLKGAIRLYRKVKGVKYEEAWGILVGVNVLRVYDKFEGLKARGIFGHFLDACRVPFEVLKFLLDMVGFQIGRGPLFDRLPDEWKAARRNCKTWDEVANFFAAFAGGFGGNDNKEDSQDRNDTEEASFSPWIFEWQPNPAIFPHLRNEYLPSLNSGPSVADSLPDCNLIKNSAGLAGRSCLDMAVDSDHEGIPRDDQQSRSAPRHTGPATMSTKLSSFACPQCNHVAKRKSKLNKHVARTHERNFQCVYDGCGETFGLRANLERHKTTHTVRQQFKCPNSWCKTPGRTFTRKDNLQRHAKACVTSQ